MEPTVDVGDQVCVDKRAYGLRVPMSETYVLRGADPARGDVIVLDSPPDGQVLLKRVVAVPGDVVAVHDGRVTIDGASVASREVDGGVEEFLGRPHSLWTEYGGGPDFGPTRVPEDKYLVLGDNRGNSKDGRYFGWVDRGASSAGPSRCACAAGARSGSRCEHGHGTPQLTLGHRGPWPPCRPLATGSRRGRSGVT
jgi:signal peptidase I